MEATQNKRYLRIRAQQPDPRERTSQEVREVALKAAQDAEEFAIDLVRQIAAGETVVADIALAVSTHVALADAKLNLTSEQMTRLYEWTRRKVDYAMATYRRSQ